MPFARLADLFAPAVPIGAAIGRISCGIGGEQLRLLREQASRPLLDDLQGYLLKIKEELLSKSDADLAVAYMLKNWVTLTRYVDDGDLPIDNNLSVA